MVYRFFREYFLDSDMPTTKMKVCHSITFGSYNDLTRGFSVRPLDFQESMRFDTVPSVSKAPTLE